MRILHCCLACFYIDNYLYQENVLPKMNMLDGHSVEIIASTETYINNVELGVTNPGNYSNEYGIQVKRLPYKKWLPQSIMRKLRYYKGLKKAIEEFNPDVILCHGMQTLDLHNITSIKRDHPSIRIYADSHEDYHNSARSFFSRNVLHKLIYLPEIKRCLNSIDKVFYISKETKEFLIDCYNLPENKLEYYPLGGIILSEVKQREEREKLIHEFNLREDAIICAHSGKMVKEKRTKELLEAFSSVDDDRLQLFIFGSIPDEQKNILMPLIERDDRVHFLGWKDNDEMTDLLAATDLYCQPGTMSSTFTASLCSGCASMLYPYSSHKYVIGEDCFYVENIEDMKNLFTKITSDETVLKTIMEKSYKKAKEILDYKELARRICK